MGGEGTGNQVRRRSGNKGSAKVPFNCKCWAFFVGFVQGRRWQGEERGGKVRGGWDFHGKTMQKKEPFGRFFGEIWKKSAISGEGFRRNCVDFMVVFHAKE